VGVFVSLDPLCEKCIHYLSTRMDCMHSPTLHNYTDYAWLRGFSIVPSWGARIEEAWWNYDAARMREEVALATEVHANCIRLWIEFTAWMADPERISAHFMDAVAAIDEAGMKTMPCLFNRWHDRHWDYGGTYMENLYGDWAPMETYVRSLVTPLATDERILCWDLCNEPGDIPTPADSERQLDWLRFLAKTVRASGAKQPILVGTMNGQNIEMVADFVDVLCGHPYPTNAAEMPGFIERYHEIQTRHEKPLLVNECLPGGLNDLERAALIQESTKALSKAGFGWMGWALKEGRAISTRRDRYDSNGIRREGFHPFFTAEGKLRDGLDFLKEKPAILAPWLR